VNSFLKIKVDLASNTGENDRGLGDDGENPEGLTDSYG
jgi:hypothetical protein